MAGPFPAAALAEIRSWVGQTPSDSDLAERWHRNGEDVLATAREVLRERLADRLASTSPAKGSIEGDVSWDDTESLKALERNLSRLGTVIDPPPAEGALPEMLVGQLTRPDRSRSR
jgi:hypothetical protein